MNFVQCFWWEMKNFVHAFLMGNEEVCSCVFGEQDLFMCFWWEINIFVLVFQVGNGVCSCVYGGK